MLMNDICSKKITIIGLGLIGGSIARALRLKAGIGQVLAVSPEQESLERAKQDGVIVKGYTGDHPDIWDSDVIFLCTPVSATPQWLHTLAGNVKPGCLITDVGSTKNEVISAIADMAHPPCFIGGHPMAGTEKNGYVHSTERMFENAYYILTPPPRTPPACMDLLLALVESMGAIPVVLEPEEHDWITACISHVPHVIASSLVDMVKELDGPEGKMHRLAAGGFKDITRIASSNPAMWQSILMSNASHVCKALDWYISRLEDIRASISSRDKDAVYRLFADARQYRDSFSSARKGALINYYDLLVDIPDTPGTIGQIATVIGSRGINIKNIHVSNSREFEEGCLILSFESLEGMEAAFELLLTTGYKVYKKQ